MKRSMKRCLAIFGTAALVLGLSGAAGANPFVVDTGGAGLSSAAACLLSESFCDPTDANDVGLSSASVTTGNFQFSTFTAGPATVTFNLDVASITLDDGGGANPVVDEVVLTNLSISGTVNVNITDSFGLKNVALAGGQTVSVSGDVEIFQGGGSLGSAPFALNAEISALSCNFFSPVTGGLCGVNVLTPGTASINVGGQTISLETFQFNPTLVLPEPTLMALLAVAGLAVVGTRRRR